MDKQLEEQLISLIKSDLWMIEILTIVRDLKLNDCWIGAGFVRNKVWDEKHGKNRTALNDIDVIHFDQLNVSKEHDLEIEASLRNKEPNLNWSIKNQVRMHLRNGHEPYNDCNQAISFWPETATSVAVRLNAKNKLECIAPHGLEDLFALKVIPTPEFNLSIYKARIEKKQWQKKWEKLTISSI